MLYHSSTSSSIEHILDDGFDEIKLPNYNNLITGHVKKGLGSYGVGLYAFLDNPDLAITFIKDELKNSSYPSDFKTICFKIDVNDDKKLDLCSNPIDMKYFSMYWDQPKVQTIFNKLRNYYPDKGAAKKFQGALIEYYLIVMRSRGKMSDIQVVIGGSQTKNSQILRRTTLPDGIEYCIRNRMAIDETSVKLFEGGE